MSIAALLHHGSDPNILHNHLLFTPLGGYIWAIVPQLLIHAVDTPANPRPPLYICPLCQIPSPKNNKILLDVTVVTNGFISVAHHFPP